MITNLGNFAHPKKSTAAGKSKRPIGLISVIGNQGKLPLPPKSKPDPINMNVNDVSMTGIPPGRGGMPMGTIPENQASVPAGKGTARLPKQKPGNKKKVNDRAKSKTMPFIGGY